MKVDHQFLSSRRYLTVSGDVNSRRRFFRRRNLMNITTRSKSFPFFRLRISPPCSDHRAAAAAAALRRMTPIDYLHAA
ncbi:hypothetical protein Hanom_Chr08g00693311 [Helianthus anomalus]